MSELKPERLLIREGWSRWSLEACEMRLDGDNEGHICGPAKRAPSQESKRICRFCLSCCWLCGFLACWFVTEDKNHIARDYHITCRSDSCYGNQRHRLNAAPENKNKRHGFSLWASNRMTRECRGGTLPCRRAAWVKERVRTSVEERLRVGAGLSWLVNSDLTLCSQWLSSASDERMTDGERPQGMSFSRFSSSRYRCEVPSVMIVHSHVKEVWEMENGMKDKVSGGCLYFTVVGETNIRLPSRKSSSVTSVISFSWLVPKRTLTTCCQTRN